jgi:hypothetical protein
MLTDFAQNSARGIYKEPCRFLCLEGNYKESVCFLVLIHNYRVIYKEPRVWPGQCFAYASSIFPGNWLKACGTYMKLYEKCRLYRPLHTLHHSVSRSAHQSKIGSKSGQNRIRESPPKTVVLL